MLWQLKDLYNWCNENHTHINGKWVPARPLVHPLRLRIQYAWKVLCGRADAVIWDESQ